MYHEAERHLIIILRLSDSPIIIVRTGVSDVLENFD